MTDVLVWADDKTHAFEILSKATEIAKEADGNVIALALGDQAASAKEFGAHGASKVLTNDHDLLKGTTQVEPYADALEQAIKKTNAGILLVGASIRGRDVAARVATRFEVGMGTDHANIRLEGGRLVGERSYYSGNSIRTEKLTKDPQIATIAARVYEASSGGDGSQASVESIELDIQQPKAKLVESKQEAAEGVNLEEADVVVSVGRGVKSKDDLKIAQDLALALGGAVGCTRPIAADLKWLGDEHWIGLSGHEVKPKAYIGLGVSGQIQHVAGMRGSKLIIAINKDEEAPLVKISDYAIIDDLYKIVPKLTEAIKKLGGGKEVTSSSTN